MSNPGECTAIIMAAGSGSRMTDLTSHCPKPLLPVGRFPMIWYPIRSLEKAGFSNIIIITRQSWEEQILSLSSDKDNQIRARLEVISIPDNEDWGTADSLRHVADKIKTSALVVSSDLISDCDLSKLISVHRKHNSSLTIMLSQLPTSIVAETLVPGFKAKQKNPSAEKISIGFDGSNLDHIVFWKAQIDMDDEHIPLTKRFLNKFPCTRIQSKWSDCHVYMINKFVIKYLSDRKELSMIGGELVPHVVRRQMSVYVQDKLGEDTEMPEPGEDLKGNQRKELIDFAAEATNELETKVNFLSLTSNSFGSTEDSPLKDLIKCYAYRQTEGFCVRANTVATYFEACKQMPRLISQFVNSSIANVPESTNIKPKSQIGTDCMLGESVTIGEKVSVKKSVIGKHCKIEDKVKITNCVILNHVTIQESSNLSNCIIVDSASIGDKCELSNCIVGQNQNISTMSKHTNEVLSTVSQLMEVNLD